MFKIEKTEARYNELTRLNLSRLAGKTVKIVKGKVVYVTDIEPMHV